MSYVTTPRKVMVTDRQQRVTERRREAVKADFIAPEMAPVSTHAREMDKGLAGWTDHDKHVPDLTRDVHAERLAKQRLREAMVGESVVRRTPAKITRVVTAGPTASYRDAQLAAQKLIERNRREAMARKAKKGAK